MREGECVPGGAETRTRVGGGKTTLLNAPPGGTDRHEKKHRRSLGDCQQSWTRFAAQPHLGQPHCD